MTTRRRRTGEGLKLDRFRESHLKKRDRERLRELGQKVKEIRRSRPVRMRRIRELCQEGRQRARAAVRLLREETRQALAGRVVALRSAQRGDCEQSKATAREELRSELERALGEKRTWGGYVKSQYGRKSRPGGITAARARRELVQESDDEVRRNLPPELVPVFNRVKAELRVGPRRTRTEAFLEWVHNNQDEAHAIIFADAERDLARYMREQQALARRLGQGYRDDEVLAAALAEVPDDEEVPF
jgi:hypothetical protein